MKITPLTDIHIALGAKMAEFAGYNMPIVYTTISEEHLCVRKKVGVFDVSHMGEFIVRGEKALDFLQSVTTNNVAKLEVGHAQYTCLPNDDGGIIDDLIVYRLPEDKCAEGERAYMLVVNASNIDKDWNWLKSKNSDNVSMENISYNSGLLAVQGPDAVKTIQKLASEDLSDIAFYNFRKMPIAGIDNVLVSATGYTGSGGFELYVHNDHLEKLWNAVMEAGEEFGIKPCGLGARDTLRMEMGYCLYGHEIDDETSPIEAGLGWITKLKKKSDFPSKQTFIDQRENGVDHKLVGFKVLDRRVPRQGYELYSKNEELIGRVTSGTQSPSLDCPIGIGFVRKDEAALGHEILVKTGKKFQRAEIVKLPFLQP